MTLKLVIYILIKSYVAPEVFQALLIIQSQEPRLEPLVSVGIRWTDNDRCWTAVLNIHNNVVWHLLPELFK